MGDLAPWLVVVPLAWSAVAFVAGGRLGASIAWVGLAAQLGLALAHASQVLGAGARRYPLGGWGAPLGIELEVDGLAAAMLLTTQAVALPVALHARAYFAREPPGAATFWPLTGALVAGLNALVLAGDVFNAYVTLEIVSLAAVGLVAGRGTVGALGAATRYLSLTLAGSGAYLFGVGLLYTAYGTVSLEVLSRLAADGAPLAVSLAAALMTVGLLIKTALFPFHGWLPPAHGGASAPVSALLSALVVAGSFTLVVRLWLGVYGGLAGPVVGIAGATLGALAIAWGSWRALTTTRLKMLIAWSTVAQVGYFFLVSPLLMGGEPRPGAVEGAFLHVASHALAKAAMFLAAGTLALASATDELGRLFVGRMPLTGWTLALAGVTLAGLPPSGGFFAKWSLLQAALEAGRADLAAVMVIGSVLTAAYVARVVRLAFLPPAGPLEPTPALREWPALALALGGVLLGLVSGSLTGLLGVR